MKAKSIKAALVFGVMGLFPVVSLADAVPKRDCTLHDERF